MRNILAIVAVSLLAAASAQAQTAPPAIIDDPAATTIEEFVVRARQPGPAWWRVSDGDSTVYILGIPDALPRGQAWDQSVLKKRLKGANSLITPPVVQAGANPLAVPGLIARWNAMGKSERDLSQTLSAADWARLERAAAASGQKSDRYRRMKPWFAGVRMVGDYRKRVRIDSSQPLKAVRNAAKAARIKPVPAHVESTKASRLLDSLAQMPPRSGDLCLSSVLAEVEVGPGIVRTTGQAWAVGDVGVALAAPRAEDRCWAAIPGVGQATRGGYVDEADAITRELKRPGHSVAVLFLRGLVARQGVLDLLRSRGFKVETPE